MRNNYKLKNLTFILMLVRNKKGKNTNGNNCWKKTLNMNLQLTQDKTREENVQRKPNITLRSYFFIIYTDEISDGRRLYYICSYKMHGLSMILLYSTIHEFIKLHKKFSKKIRGRMVN